MKRNKKKNIILYAERLFPRDPVTGKFIIEILLEKYIYAFNEWDSSYFRRRDLDPDLVDFLENCSESIPLNEDFQLSFTVTQERDEEIEKVLTDSIKNYFTFSQIQLFEKIKNLYKRALLYGMFSFLLLFLAIFSETSLPDNYFSRLFLEGAFIGGWVFLWEAISNVVFQRADIARQHIKIKRLINTPMVFIQKLQESIVHTHNPGAQKKETLARIKDF
jgi:hypothetical protein